MQALQEELIQTPEVLALEEPLRARQQAPFAELGLQVLRQGTPQGERKAAELLWQLVVGVPVLQAWPQA